MAVRALARVNLAAIERNVERLRGGLADGAGLCAVVKGGGYGHGALPGGARGAGRRGADARGGDGRRGGRAAGRRDRGADARDGGGERRGAAGGAGGSVPSWSPGPSRSWTAPAGGPPARLRPRCACTSSSTPAWAGLGPEIRTRLCASPSASSQAGPALELAGAMTHFASADEDPSFTSAQLGRFMPFVAAMRERWPFPGIVVHAANSAATLREPASQFDLVRCGIAIYGCDPMNDDPASHGLEPALELTSYVAAVKLARAGRERRLRPAVGGAVGHVDGDGADRLRGRDPPRADQQLRRADRRPALSAGRHRQHGQHHGRARHARCGSASGTASRSSVATATSARRRRRWRAGSARSTTRSSAG